MWCTESLRAFKESMKLGRFKDVDPEEQQRREAERLQKERDEEEKAQSIQVGDRWECFPTIYCIEYFLSESTFCDLSSFTNDSM